MYKRQAITNVGKCEGDVAVFCEDGKVVRLDCPSFYPQRRCDLVDGLYDCTPTCGTITDVGECVGNVNRWCEKGAFRSFNCDEISQSCVKDDYGWFVCQ